MAASVFDQTADLWLKVDQFHLNFLKSEENTKKIEIRKKLEGFIHQYLCLVPQNRKFCHPSTGDIILQSCRMIPEFSAITAATAFEAIEKYAANLINQPWRKEFREIKQYGGFYKHQIQKFITGAEILFHQMGYLSTDHETFILEGPIEQDRITTVARDCILAFVECQILASIVQGVAVHFPCSWEEALIFRRDHIGTPDQAVRSLVYLKNQTQFQQNLQSVNNMAVGVPYYNRAGSYAPSNFQSLPGYYHNNPQMSGLPNGMANGHVPIAKLVDVSFEDSKRGKSSDSSSGSTVTGNQVPIPETIKHLEEEIRRKSLIAPSESKHNPNSLETWDYVYRGLENIGYTKDQSERPNVLSLLNHVIMKKEQEMQHQRLYQQQQQQQQQYQHHPQQHLPHQIQYPSHSPVHHQSNYPSQQQNQLQRSPQQQGKQQYRYQPADNHLSPSYSEDIRQGSDDATTSDDESSKRLLGSSRSRAKFSQQEDNIDNGGVYQSPAPQRHYNQRTTSSFDQYQSGKHSENDIRSPEDINVTVTLPHRAARHTKPLRPPSSSPQPPKLPQKKKHMVEELQNQQSHQQLSSRSGDWSCHACTYRNKSNVDICAICSKSKNFVYIDSESGGCTTDDYETTNGDESFDENSIAESESKRSMIQCGKCTLLNKKVLKVCDACGASLHISPVRNVDDGDS